MLLKLQNIDHSFGGNIILKDLSYSFKSGYIHAIVGSNGTGKSTLLNIINGYIKPVFGKITVDEDIDITYNSVVKNNNLGILRLWQYGEVFKNISAIDNLRVVPKQFGENLFNYFFKYKKIKEQEQEITIQAREVLSVFNLTKKGDELCGNLSLGEQKLLAFGRILMDNRVKKGNTIILMDEPYSGINFININIISKLIQEFASYGNIVILVEHNIQRVKQIATKKLILKNYILNEVTDE